MARSYANDTALAQKCQTQFQPRLLPFAGSLDPPYPVFGLITGPYPEGI